MKNIKVQLLIGLVSIFLGIVIAIQFKSIQDNYIGSLVPIQKAQGLAAELKKVRAEKEELLKEISSLESKINEIEESAAKEDVLIRNIMSELDKYKMASGLKAVKGPGVVITIDDPPAEDDFTQEFSVIMYNYDLLLSLINKLNDAGAEAISINEQRIIATTEISLAGNNVNINSIPTAPPFEIKAIGNPDTLDSTVNIRFGIIEQMKKSFKLQITVQKEDEIVIPRYKEVIKYRYATPVE